jgi:hypothetical protein
MRGDMRNLGWFASTFLAVLCSGCSAYDNPLLSSGPYPRVEDCALIQQATPTKYVCGGKTYTSVQLADISAGKNLEAPRVQIPVPGPGNSPVTLPAPAKSNP